MTKEKLNKHWKVSESAWKEERTAFNHMLDYAKKHDNVKHIIFDVTDRMTRNDMDKIKIYTLIKLHDKTIHFSRSNKTISKFSGPEDEFMLDIEVAVAKKMSNDISRKTRMGMDEKAQQGNYPSVASVGYRNNLATHLIEIDEQKTFHIKKIFSLIASGHYSINMVAEILHEDGFRTNKGNRVAISTLGHLLKNPIYYGAFRWNGVIYQGSHTPIISKDVFDQVQKILGNNFRPYLTKHNFPFNNLIKCGLCGCRVLGELKKNKYIYYHCTFKKGRHKDTDNRYITQERLAALFENPIKKVTLSGRIVNWLQESMRAISQDTVVMQQKRLNSLKAQLEKAKNRLSRLYDLKLDGEIDNNMFKIKENEYKTRIIESESKIRKSENINPNFYEDACKTFELAKGLHSQYIQGDYAQKAKILKFIGSNYTLIGEKLIPAYKKPFDIFAKGPSSNTWLPG